MTTDDSWGQTHKSLTQSVTSKPRYLGGTDIGHDNLLDQIQEAVGDRFAEVIASGKDAVLCPPPGSGKSFSAANLLRKSDRPGVYLSPLTDRYEEFGTRYGPGTRVAPSLPRYCDSYEEGNEVYSYYNRGFTPREIHYDLGLCSSNCKYLERLPETDDNGNYVPYDEAEVLIGNPAHSYVTPYINKRIVIFDDVRTGMFIQRFQADANELNFILESSDFPADTPEQLYALEGMEKIGGRTALADMDFNPEEDETTHTKAKQVAETILEATPLGNGYGYHYNAEEDFIGVTNGSHEVWLMERPAIPPSTQVIILDAYPMVFQGDPIWRMWQLGIDLEVVQPLSDDELNRYITDGQNISIHQTANFPNSLNNWGNYSREDERIIKYIANISERNIPVISTRKAINEMEDVLPVSDTLQYSNVPSSNRYKDEDVGLVLGCGQYSDEYLKRLGAFMFQSIEPNDEHGTERSYGKVGDMILRDHREHMVAQAILRFGRSTDTETDVYVHTSAIPDDIPITSSPDENRDYRFDCEGQILDQLRRAGGSATTTELKEACTFGYNNSLLSNLNQLELRGVVESHTPNNPAKPDTYHLRE